MNSTFPLNIRHCPLSRGPPLFSNLRLQCRVAGQRESIVMAQDSNSSVRSYRGRRKSTSISYSAWMSSLSTLQLIFRHVILLNAFGFILLVIPLVSGGTGCRLSMSQPAFFSLDVDSSNVMIETVFLEGVSFVRRLLAQSGDFIGENDFSVSNCAFSLFEEG